MAAFIFSPSSSLFDLPGAPPLCPWRLPTTRLAFTFSRRFPLPISAHHSFPDALTDGARARGISPEAAPDDTARSSDRLAPLNIPHDLFSAIVSHAPAFCRSSAIFIGVFLLVGVRAVVGAQNPVVPKHLPVFARVSSVQDNARVPSSVEEAKSKNSDKQVDAEGKTAHSEDKALAAAAKDTRKTHTRIDSSSDQRGRDAEVVENYEDEFDEQYGEEDDEYDEFDDVFIDVDADERTQRASTEFSEPQTKTKVDTDMAAKGINAEVVAKMGEDKELQKVFEEWRSTPYKLTVPLRVVGLRGSVPTVWVKDFILSQGRRAKTTIEYQGALREIMSALASALEKKQVKPRSILSADVVTVGDSWLRLAVSGGLIEPIDNAEHHDWFKRLDQKWQALLRRDEEGRFNSKGLIWGVPYRWGSMVIAYKNDRLAKNNIPGIKDWRDLWRPELAGKIAMVDSPREVVGAVLKSLGASYNAQDFDKDVHGGKEAVKRQFLSLQKQVRLFDSVHYLKALGSGDVWVAVGWSSDVIPVAKRMSNITVIAPESGSSLWADLWAIPAATAVPTDKIGSRVRGASPLIHQWFDFCLQPARALPFRQGVFVGASPLDFDGACQEPLEHKGNQTSMADVSRVHTADESIGETVLVDVTGKGPKVDTNLIEGMLPKDILAKSEFLEPLSYKAIAEYEWLFKEITQQDGQPGGLLQTIKRCLETPFGQNSQRG